MSPTFWLSYVLRSVRRGGRRTLVAIVCVAVGVIGVVALQTAALTVRNALTSNVRAANGGDISITSDAAPLSRSDLATFRRLQQRGKISSWTAVYSVHATAVGTRHELVPFDVNVVSAPPYPLGGEPTFVTPGNGHVAALLQHRGDVLLTSVLADELGVGVGSRLLVNSIGGHGLHATVRGILSETSFEHSAAMTVSRRDAPVLSQRPARYTAVYINLPGTPDAVANELRFDFPAATVQTVSDALQANRQQVHDFQQFMLLVGLLALLIAGVGTLNAMQSMLARRRLEIAMLKALGFGQGTLYGLFGGDALLIGLAGGLLGTAVGAAASKLITDALARAMAIQVSFVLDGWTLVAGVALGVGAALVFAVLPIVRAAGYRPLEVLREGPAPASSWLQTMGLLIVILLLFGALASVILGDTVVALEFVLGAFLACAVLTGAFALLVAWIGRVGRPRSLAIGLVVLVALLALTGLALREEPSLAALVAFVALLWTATVVLPGSWLLPLLIAARSLSRRRARTSVTLVAFLAGILAMTVTLTVALSLQSQINDILASTGSTNLVAITNPQGEQSVLKTSHTLPGIQQQTVVEVIATNPVAVNGRKLSTVIGPAPATTQGADENDRARFLGGLSGWDLRRGDGPPGIKLADGRLLGPQDAGTNHVLVHSALQSYPYYLALGDRIRLRESGSGISRPVTIVGFYHRARRGRGFGSFFTPPIHGDRALALSLGGSDTQSVVSYTIASDQLAHDATTLQRAVPGALVIDIGDLTAIVERILNELLNLLAVITALVLGAGVAVVANGVTLAMLERRREIALFKAIGFGPASVLQFVLVENGLIGMLAGAVSVLAAAVSLRVLSRVALDNAVGFDPVVALIVLIIAAALAVVTAYVTAHRPIQVRPIEVLRNE